MNIENVATRMLRQRAILSSFASIETSQISKDDLAKLLFSNQQYDLALPQAWVAAMEKRGFDVRPHFVTLYPKKEPAYFAPVTPQGIKMAAIIASDLT